MPVTYAPMDFWHVVFARTGSAVPKIFPRAFGVAMIGVLAALLDHYDSLWTINGNEIDLHFFHSEAGLIVGLLVSFRLNFAYNKWERAVKCILDMHSQTRSIISKLCAYCPSHVDEVERQIERCRRWLVLGCVLIKKHVRMEKTFEDELRTGLITPEEVEHFTKAVCSYSVVDGKKDRYPSRNRPALVFHMLHQATTDLYKAGHFPSFNHHLGIEQDITVLSNIFEEIEYLGCTIIPLPYAQLTRVVSLFYVISLPFGTAPALGWFTPLLTLAASLIYFTVDECASEMETPFEGRENDVDLEKMIRRIDKHTSALFSSYRGKPALNYDIFPQTRRTDASGAVIKTTQQAATSLYELSKRPSKLSMAAGDGSPTKRLSAMYDRSRARSSAYLRGRSSAKLGSDLGGVKGSGGGSRPPAMGSVGEDSKDSFTIQEDSKESQESHESSSPNDARASKGGGRKMSISQKIWERRSSNATAENSTAEHNSGMGIGPMKESMRRDALHNHAMAAAPAAVAGETNLAGTPRTMPCPCSNAATSAPLLSSKPSPPMLGGGTAGSAALSALGSSVKDLAAAVSHTSNAGSSEQSEKIQGLLNQCVNLMLNQQANEVMASEMARNTGAAAPSAWGGRASAPSVGAGGKASALFAAVRDDADDDELGTAGGFRPTRKWRRAALEAVKSTSMRDVPPRSPPPDAADELDASANAAAAAAAAATSSDAASSSAATSQAAPGSDGGGTSQSHSAEKAEPGDPMAC